MEFVQNFPFMTIILSLFSGPLSSVLDGKKAKRLNLAVISLIGMMSAAVLGYVLKTGEPYVYLMGHFPAPWGNEIRVGYLEAFMALYFLSENEAMNYTTTTNTSLIVCSCPLFATLLVRMVYKDSNRIHIVQLLGNRHRAARHKAQLAFVGMIIVVLNGRFVLHLSSVGDALAFTACMSWAVYSLLMKSVSGDYGAAFITRKVFFYGVLTILPYYLIIPGWPACVYSR